MTIYLSFENNNREYAIKLSGELTELGYSVWGFDGQESTAPGSLWEEEISSRIQRCNYIVFLLSERAIKSNWINKEVRVAVELADERGDLPLIPVVLDDVEIPDKLRKYQVILDLAHDPRSTAHKVREGIDAFRKKEETIQKEKEERLKRVEKSAADFVSAALNDLRKRESNYRSIAYIMYGLSYLTLFLSTLWGLWHASKLDYTTASIQSIIQAGVVGLLALAIVIALAKYTFTLGKSFMVESLRNADRCHAISFGEFYLKAFGESSSKEQIMEAFKEWNIDKGSFFIRQETKDFDPQVINLIAEIAKISTKSKSK